MELNGTVCEEFFFASALDSNLDEKKMKICPQLELNETKTDLQIFKVLDILHSGSSFSAIHEKSLKGEERAVGKVI